MVAYYGTSAHETLNSSNWNPGWTNFFMEGGHDTVITRAGTGAVYFSGGTGDDYFWGDRGSDTAIGGSGMDILKGDAGNDWLWGGSHSDSLEGGSGVDTLVGGTGRDNLTGGPGSTDYFQFALGDSSSTQNLADVITDWDVRYDYIDSSIAGTSSNYGETYSSARTLDDARTLVETTSLRAKDHVFVTNAATDTGYLLSDLDGNYTFETGVVIRGAGAASDMNWSDII